MTLRHKSGTSDRVDLRVVLPVLRKIGFDLWDPLGLRDAFEHGEPIADEYDSDLLRAFTQAWRSNETTKVEAILKDAEKRLGGSLPDRDRTRTVEAIMRMAEGNDAARKNANQSARIRAT